MLNTRNSEFYIQAVEEILKTNNMENDSFARDFLLTEAMYFQFRNSAFNGANLNRKFSPEIEKKIALKARYFVQNMVDILVAAQECKNDLIKKLTGEENYNQQLSVKKIEVCQGSDPHKKLKRLCFVTIELSQKQSQPQLFQPTQTFKVVYKPTSLAVDKIIADPDNGCLNLLKEDLLKQDLAPGLPGYWVLAPLNRRFGFMKYITPEVENRTLSTEFEIDSYSFIFGFNSTIMLMFRISDRHQGNLLAYFFIPIWIDLETSFQWQSNPTNLISSVFGYPSDLFTTEIEEKNAFPVDENNTPVYPFSPSLVAGFKYGMQLFAEKYDLIVKFLRDDITKNNSREDFIVRYVPFNTSDINQRKQDISDEELGCFLYTFGIWDLLCAYMNETNAEQKKELATKLKLKLLVLAYKEYINFDKNNGDVPYYAVNIFTGQLFNSEFQELKWDDEKIKQLLCESFKQMKGDLPHILNQADWIKDTDFASIAQKIIDLLNNQPSETPINAICAKIKSLGKEYQEHNKNIEQCSLYKECVTFVDSRSHCTDHLASKPSIR